MLPWCVLLATSLFLTHGIAQGQDRSNSSEAAKKRQIMESPEWKQAKYAFDEWISVQKIYDAKRVAEIKKQLRANIEAMTAEEFGEFLLDMQNKLKILTSKEAREARAWLARNMALAAAPYRAKMRKKLPDVASMTAAQLDQALRTFEAQRAASAKESVDAASARKQQIQATQQYLQESQRARERALDRNTYNARNYSRSNYVPPVQINLNVPVQRSYPYSGPFSNYSGYRW